MARYRYVITPSKIIVLSTFAGKDVRGIAKCSPHDSFDEKVGTELALKRCNAKVAAKRLSRAVEKVNAAKEALDEAQKFYDYMCEYHRRSAEDYSKELNQLVEFENKLK